MPARYEITAKGKRSYDREYHDLLSILRDGKTETAQSLVKWSDNTPAEVQEELDKLAKKRLVRKI